MNRKKEGTWPRGNEAENPTVREPGKPEPMELQESKVSGGEHGHARPPP
jgi:hypothetical protein